MVLLRDYLDDEHFCNDSSVKSPFLKAITSVMASRDAEISGIQKSVVLFGKAVFLWL